ARQNGALIERARRRDGLLAALECELPVAGTGEELHHRFGESEPMQRRAETVGELLAFGDVPSRRLTVPGEAGEDHEPPLDGATQAVVVRFRRQPQGLFSVLPRTVRRTDPGMQEEEREVDAREEGAIGGTLGELEGGVYGFSSLLGA